MSTASSEFDISQPRRTTLAGRVAAGLSSAICGVDITVGDEEWECDSTYCPVDGSSAQIEVDFTAPGGDTYCAVVTVSEVTR